MNKCEIFNTDCIEFMEKMTKGSVNCVLTDIPYGEVSRPNNGLSQMKNSDKGAADAATFNLDEFLPLVDKVASDNIIIFCGKGQFSIIYNYFVAKPTGTVRQLIWKKTNPVPSNGRYVYLSGIENAVWYRKPKGTYNGYCKNTVFEYPIQSRQIHPTEKNHKLFEELILDNTNEGQTIFDPCMGSAVSGLMALKNGRNFIGCELNEEFFNIAKERLIKEKLYEEVNN